MNRESSQLGRSPPCTAGKQQQGPGWRRPTYTLACTLWASQQQPNTKTPPPANLHEQHHQPQPPLPPSPPPRKQRHNTRSTHRRSSSSSTGSTQDSAAPRVCGDSSSGPLLIPLPQSCPPRPGTCSSGAQADPQKHPCRKEAKSGQAPAARAAAISKSPGHHTAWGVCV